MEDCTTENNSKKRARDESVPDSNSSELKRYRVDSVTDVSEPVRVDSFTDLSEANRDDPEIPEMNSPDAAKIAEDILEILDDPDNDPEIHDLDSVIKSFEEEILNPDAKTDSGELDYLLGASDDELGLPPASSPSDEYPQNDKSDLVTSQDDGVELKEDFAFVDELPSYDSYELGTGEENVNNSEFVIVGGLFDYSEAPEYLWQPESLSAL